MRCGCLHEGREALVLEFSGGYHRHGYIGLEMFFSVIGIGDVRANPLERNRLDSMFNRLFDKLPKGRPEVAVEHVPELYF